MSEQDNPGQDPQWPPHESQPPAASDSEAHEPADQPATERWSPLASQQLPGGDEHEQASEQATQHLPAVDAAREDEQHTTVFPSVPSNAEQPGGYPPAGQWSPGYAQPSQQPGYPASERPQPGYPPAGYQPGGHQPSGYQPPGYQQPAATPYRPPTPGYQQPGYQQPGYQQPGYQQPGYQQGYQQPNSQQPGYQQQSYGPSSYAPQPSYQQPGYPGYQQPGYAEPQPAQPRKKGKGLLLSLLGLGVVIIAVVLILLLWKPGFLVTKNLSHTAVESYISQQFSAQNVKCNGGSDITIKKGKTFTCSSSGTSYTVTMTDDSGTYEVKQGG